jgi:hypothetical protein
MKKMHNLEFRGCKPILHAQNIGCEHFFFPDGTKDSLHGCPPKYRSLFSDILASTLINETGDGVPIKVLEFPCRLCSSSSSSNEEVRPSPFFFLTDFSPQTRPSLFTSSTCYFLPRNFLG